MKTFTQQNLISQKECMSVLPKTELSIQHLMVAIFTKLYLPTAVTVRNHLATCLCLCDSHKNSDCLPRQC